MLNLTNADKRALRKLGIVLAGQDRLTIVRLMKNEQPVYLYADGRTVRRPHLVQRWNALAIPPAWNDVRVAPEPNLHLPRQSASPGARCRAGAQLRGDPHAVGMTDTAPSLRTANISRLGAEAREGFVGTAAHVIGSADDYLREPHFKGGTWRYAAVQLGGMQAFTKSAVDHVTMRGQETAPLQSRRILGMLAACETCRLWLSSFAPRVEAAAASPSLANEAVLLRLHVAEQAKHVLTLGDDAMGAASFVVGHPAERVRRDLQFYIRQANPDGHGVDAVTAILRDGDQHARWCL